MTQLENQGGFCVCATFEMERSGFLCEVSLWLGCITHFPSTVTRQIFPQISFDVQQFKIMILT